MNSQSRKSATDGLPVSFVNSLNTLFNILDEKKSGFVDINEIESRWQDGEVDGLPAGVIDALRKVTPQSGKLSFERFVAGLKIALLRHRNKESSSQLSSRSTPNFEYGRLNDERKQASSAFYPVQGSKGEYASSRTNPKGPGKFGTDNSLIQQRTHSMPLLQNVANGDSKPTNSGSDTNTLRKTSEFYPNEYHGDYYRPKERWDRKPGDGRSSVATSTALEFMNKNFLEQQNGPTSQNGSRRRESRRHTLSSGLDNNMIRRLKLLDQEREILSQGLEMVNGAKQWYEERMRLVKEKQQNMGRVDGQNDQSFEANQERLNLQTVRIQELNQQLKVLMESPHKGFPLHMNLAVKQSPHRSEMSEKDNSIMLLKSQNRLLTKEVGQQTNQIEQLEREKAQLIQKMFNSEGGRHTPYKSLDDTTFI